MNPGEVSEEPCPACQDRPKPPQTIWIRIEQAVEHVGITMWLDVVCTLDQQSPGVESRSKLILGGGPRSAPEAQPATARQGLWKQGRRPTERERERERDSHGERWEG